MPGPHEFDNAGAAIRRHADNFYGPFETCSPRYPVVGAIDLGAPIDVAEIFDRIGYRLVKKGDKEMLLTILGLVGALLPVISQGILTVEQPGVPGAQKAAAVTDLALGTLEAVSPGTVAKVGHNNIFGGIQAAITSLVSHFNKTGALPKKTENATAQGGPVPVTGSGKVIAGSAPGA